MIRRDHRIRVGIHQFVDGVQGPFPGFLETKRSKSSSRSIVWLSARGTTKPCGGDGGFSAEVAAKGSSLATIVVVTSGTPRTDCRAKIATAAASASSSRPSAPRGPAFAIGLIWKFMRSGNG